MNPLYKHLEDWNHSHTFEEDSVNYSWVILHCKECGLKIEINGGVIWARLHEDPVSPTNRVVYTQKASAYANWQINLDTCEDYIIMSII